MMRALVAMIALSSVAACNKAETSQARVRIERVAESDLRLVPSKGQLPFCLAFTVAKNGLVRQLTMDPKNQSVACEAEQPIGGLVYKIPPKEGDAVIYVVFSDHALDATPIAQQIRELTDHTKPVSAMDLRAPGNLVIERLEFSPK